MKKKKLVIVIVIVPILVVIISFFSFIGWVSYNRSAMPEALDALNSNQEVVVEEGRWISFFPKTSAPSTCFVFYPGGLVDARAYAPLARVISLAGYLVVIVPMPLNLAILAPNEATVVIAAYPEISIWSIGGHSLGGTSAAGFCYSNPGVVEGLVLLASYPADSDNLTLSYLNVVSIYASLDGVVSRNVPETLNLLPEGTILVEIKGGNHAQFGYYGEQSGDNPATISRTEQQQITIQAISSHLENLGT